MPQPSDSFGDDRSRALSNHDTGATTWLRASGLVLWEAQPDPLRVSIVSERSDRNEPADSGAAGNWFDGVHPADRRRIEAEMREMMRARRGGVMAYRRLRPDGTVANWRDLVSLGSTAPRGRLRWFGAGMEATGEAMNEAPHAWQDRAPEPDERLDYIEALVVVLDERGDIRRANRCAARALGQTAEHLTGASFASTFASSATMSRLAEAVERARRPGTPTACIATLRPNAGQSRRLRWSIAGVRDEAGVARAFVATGFEWGGSQLGTGSEVRTSDDDWRAERMASLVRFARSVGHTLGDPLTALMAYTDALSAALAGRLEDLKILEEIRAAAEQVHALQRQLNAIGRRTVTEPQAIDIESEIIQLGDVIGRLVGEENSVQFDLAAGRPQVVIDPGPFSHAMLDLVLHARDLLPAGSRLRVSTRLTDLDRAPHLPAQLSANMPAGAVVIEFSNAIAESAPDQVRERLAEPSEWGSVEARDWTNAETIARSAGGTFECHGADHAAPTFRLWLPRCEPAPGASEAPPLTRAPRVAGGETILLVEDDTIVRQLLIETLRREGYEVVEAARPNEAIDLATAGQRAFSLLVTDIEMPGMSGRHLAAQLAERQPGMRVLYLSGHGDDIIERWGVDPQGLEFLAKPFDPRSFARRVRMLLDHSAA